MERLVPEVALRGLGRAGRGLTSAWPAWGSAGLCRAPLVKARGQGVLHGKGECARLLGSPSLQRGTLQCRDGAGCMGGGGGAGRRVNRPAPRNTGGAGVPRTSPWRWNERAKARCVPALRALAARVLRARGRQRATGERTAEHLCVVGMSTCARGVGAPWRRGGVAAACGNKSGHGALRVALLELPQRPNVNANCAISRPAPVRLPRRSPSPGSGRGSLRGDHARHAHLLPPRGRPARAARGRGAGLPRGAAPRRHRVLGGDPGGPQDARGGCSRGVPMSCPTEELGLGLLGRDGTVYSAVSLEDLKTPEVGAKA